MRYIISCENPHRHFIQIEFIVPVVTNNTMALQLPAWRPGRYTLQNLAKNVRAFAVYNEKGNALQFEKTSKDCWQVKSDGAKQVHVKYEYYANVLDAGSTFLDEFREWGSARRLSGLPEVAESRAMFRICRMVGLK